MKRRKFIRQLALAPLLASPRSSQTPASQGTTTPVRPQQPKVKEPHTSSATEVYGEKPVQIGIRKQLFVDDFALSHLSNLTRELGEVTKANGGQPLLFPDQPWEDPFAFGCFGSVLHDGVRFRLWYRPFTAGVAYAESVDGLRWQKPILELYDFDFGKIKKLGGFETTEKLSLEILDPSGEPIPGFTRKESKPLEARDDLRFRPEWEKHADLAALKGQVIRLKLYLGNARLYAFQVKS